MRRVIVQWWAVIFVVLCVCPVTAPFSTFDTAGPHGMASDTHDGVASAKFLTDEAATPGVLPAPSYSFVPLQPVFRPLAPFYAYAGPVPSLILRI